MDGKGSAIQIDVTVPVDDELGIFAWCASNAEYLRACGWAINQPIHRCGFALQSKKKNIECAVSLKTGAWTDLEKLNDPVVFAAEECNIELLEVLKRSKAKYQWKFTQKALVQAVKKGQLEALQWLFENEVVADESYSVVELVTTAMDASQMDPEMARCFIRARPSPLRERALRCDKRQSGGR